MTAALRTRNGSKLGSVTVLESEPGSGKTEAALLQFFDMARSGLVDGLYFSLPTRTSAIQIHGRIVDAMRKRYPINPPPVVLAVPGYTRVDDEDGKLVHHRVLWDDDRMSNRGWFVENSKRYLAAPVAVGTIDQLVMGPMNFKHATMRWASASQSLLVVDEVHASDPHMARLIEEVVRRHVARGGHILLMSATLGSSLARRCLAAAAPSGGVPLPPLAETVELPYPLIRRTQPGRPVTDIVFKSTGRQKDVFFKREGIIDEPDTVAALAADHVRRGAKVLVIRNTVGACNDVHRRLERLLPPDMMMRAGVTRVTSPHHGRFAPEDRRVLDVAVGETFGKGTPSRGVVLCATQTVEQSLDIDADVVITDICPMDVLLQRIGRLHRHANRVRPAGYERATIHVLVPGHPIADYALKARNGIGWERAYVDVRMVCATEALIAKLGEISVPRDNRMLVERTCHPEALAGIEAGNPTLEQYGLRVAGRGFADRDVAAFSLRDPNWRHGDDLPPEQEGEIATRLGLKDSSATFPGIESSALGQMLRHVRIPHWLLPAGLIQQELTGPVTKHSNGSMGFNWGSESYVYGRCGLERGRFDDVELAGRGTDPG